MARRRTTPDPWSMLLDFSAPAESAAAPAPEAPPAPEPMEAAAPEAELLLPLMSEHEPVVAPKRSPGRPPKRSRQPPPYPPLSAVRGMWLFAMFDLPVETKTDRRNYTKFRKALLAEGFMMLQFSVYAIYCASDEVSEKYRRRVRSELPPAGQVRLVAITDLQFGKMDIFFGKSREKPEDSPSQLVLF